MTTQIAFRRVAPVLGGLLTVVVVTTATDVVMHATGIFQAWGERMADGLFLLPLGYRIMYAELGGHIAARLATSRQVSHAVALGAIGFVLSAIGTAVTMDQSAAYG